MGARKIQNMKRKKPSYQEEEKVFTAGEVGSMLEQVNEGVTVIAEELGSLKTQVNSRLDNLQEDITDIKFGLVNKIERGEFEKLEKRVIKVERAVFSKKS